VNTEKDKELMRIENTDTIGKLEAIENDAQEMTQATFELARSVMRMSDNELQVAMDLAHEDMCKANDEVEYARMNRELHSMRLTIMEYEQVRRSICSE